MRVAFAPVMQERWRMSRRAKWVLAVVCVASFAGGLWFGLTDPGDGTVELQQVGQ